MFVSVLDLAKTETLSLLRDRHGNVIPLQCSSFVVFRVDPGSHCQLVYEDLCSFGEQDGSFGADHFHVFVKFHNLQWETTQTVNDNTSHLFNF
jgi:hypothetical protein